MSKRILSMLLALALVLGMFPTVAPQASAAETSTEVYSASTYGKKPAANGYLNTLTLTGADVESVDVSGTTVNVHLTYTTAADATVTLTATKAGALSSYDTLSPATAEVTLVDGAATQTIAYDSRFSTDGTFTVNLDIVSADSHTHNYSTLTELDDASHTATCSCGDSITEEHSFSGWSKQDDENHVKSCDCGKIVTEGHTLSESWTYSTSNAHIKTCSVCSGSVSEGHTYGEAEETNDEFHSTLCSVCNEGKNVAHTWETAVTVEATETTSGTKTHTCSGCGKVKVETYTLNEEGVTLTPTVSYPSGNYHVGTFTLFGADVKSSTFNTADVQRSAGRVYTDTTANFAWSPEVDVVLTSDTAADAEIKLRIGSMVNNGKTIVSPADWEADGAYYSVQLVDGEGQLVFPFAVSYTSFGNPMEERVYWTFNFTVAEICNHTYANEDAYVSVDGETHDKTCDSCGEVVNEEHNWNTGSVTKEPTATEAGTKTYVCKNCFAVKTEDIPANGVTSLDIQLVAANGSADSIYKAEYEDAADYEEDKVMDDYIYYGKDGDQFQFKAYDQEGNELTGVTWTVDEDIAGKSGTIDENGVLTVDYLKFAVISFIYVKASYDQDGTEISQEKMFVMTGYDLHPAYTDPTFELDEDGAAVNENINAGVKGHTTWSAAYPETNAAKIEETGVIQEGIEYGFRALRPGTFSLTYKVDFNENMTQTTNITIKGVAVEDSEEQQVSTRVEMSNDTPNPTTQLTAYAAEGLTVTGWSSEDTSIATVDENGLVTAQGVGRTVIHATDSDGNVGGITVIVTHADIPYFEELNFATGFAGLNPHEWLEDSFKPTVFSYKVNSYLEELTTLPMTPVFNEKWNASYEITYEGEYDAVTGTLTTGEAVNLPVQGVPCVITITIADPENAENKNVYIFALNGAETGEPVPVTVKGMHSAQIASVKLYTYTDGVKGETDLLEGVETVADGYMYLYNTELAPGDYWAEGYDANGDCNGGIKLTVTSDGENVFYLQRVYQIYATNSGWIKDTDYTIDVKVTDQQRNEREITVGTANSWGTVYASCLYLYGDTVEVTLTPIGERAATCVANTISKTGTTNMSVSGKISECLNMTFVVPEGSTVDVGKFSTYYIYSFYEQTEDPADLELEEGMTAFTFSVPKDSVNMSMGPYFFYRVQNEDGVTYWDFFAPASYTESAVTVTLTAEQLFIGSTEFTADTIYHNYEKNTYDTADIYLNINGQGYMDLDVGETFELNVFRNWMAIENFYNRRVALPDMHYEVITVDGSNVITIEEDANNSSVATLTATGEGTAIVKVTYDAMYSNCAYVSGSAYQPGYFSAIWPENTGVFVVTVGKDGTSIETGMTIDRNGTTGTLDAEHDHLYYLGTQGASYTFTPEADTTVTVNRSTVSSTDMTFGAFVSTGVSENEDGSVTVSGLTEGRHIIKVEKGGVASYQVITAKQAAYELQDAEGNALTADQIAAIGAGDTVYVQFSGLTNPCEKMSGVYNHAPAVLYVGEDGTSFVSSGTSGIGVYGFGGTPSLQKVAITIPKYWTAESYTVGGYIRMNTSGSGAGAHRSVSYVKGMNANFAATVGSNVLCALPELTFTLAETEFLTGKLEFVDQNGEAVTADLSVTMTDADGNAVVVNEDYTFGCLAGEYSFIINGAGVQYYTGSVTVTEDGDNVFTVTLTTTDEGAWDGVTVTEPAVDENGVYLISNGAEMAWFSQQNQNNKADISGKLTADIDLACYPWNNTLTFANYATVLEGDGHSITNLNATRGIFGALGANSSVKNLTVYGTVSGGNQAGSVAGYINGANTAVENIVNYASVSGTNCTGGIVGTTYSDGITVRDCVNHGIINTTGSNVGGIIGSTGSATVEGCYNTADITGGSNVGGIFGTTGSAANVIACYNTGNISGTNNIGGVGGNLSGPSWGTGTASLRDCYSTGTVTATNSNVGGALGYYNASKAAAERLYYLEGAYTSDPTATVLTSEQLKSAELAPEYFGGTCSDYPALLWQTDVTFHSTEREGVVTAPTCTEKGYTTYTCDTCGAGYNAEYVDATGHAWCEDTEGCDNCVYTAPTCTVDGSIARTCLHEGCEEPKTDVIPATGHTEDESQTVDHEIYKDCVCSVCGESYRVWDDARVQYMTLDVDILADIVLEDNTYPWAYNASTGRIESTNKGVNSSTSQTSITVTLTEAADVSFNYGVSSEANYDKLTITAASGETVIAAIANGISGTQESLFSYELPAGSYTLTFAYTKDSGAANGSDIGWFSGLTIAAKHVHSYEAVVTAPTCTEGGYTTYTCTCGDTYTADETEMVDHSYVAGVCTVCGVADPDYVPATVSVYFSLSDDADFVTGSAGGEVMALKEITVPYFDLGLYGLEDFYFFSETYGDDGDGQPGSDLAPGTPEYAEGKITMLHLYIYATEVYQCGVDASEAGKGYLYNEGLLNTETLSISGTSGSTFLNYFWDMDMNLNYYLNYEYPLASEGWGATSDQILLEDGDIVTLGHFTSWSFYSDSTSVFNFIANGDETVATTAIRGSELELTLYHAGENFSGGSTTAHTAVTSEPEVFCAPVDAIPSGTVSEEGGWTSLGKANADGTITVDTSDLAPGEYIIAIAGQYGAEYPDDICSTPGGLLLSLNECEAHEFESVVVAPTCYAEGYTEYTCKLCNMSYRVDFVDALGHEMQDVVTEATHDKMGYTTTTCKVCGFSYVHGFTDALEHAYEKEITKAASCTEDGEMTFTCECGDSYTQVIPKTGHACVASETAATCEGVGCTTYQCENCDFSYINDLKNALGHTETTVNSVDATWHETGYTGDTVCSVCGKELGKGTEIPALGCPSKAFTDVDTEQWYHEEIDYVVANGLMNGIDDTTFAPNAETNRAMLATLLYRMAGEPDTTGLENPFADVVSDAWYADAVIWAASEGIVNGTSETTFDPGAAITREQMVTMLWRYAGEPTADAAALEGYTDASTVSGYAKDAMAWAIGSGIVNGMSETTLAPQGTANRAQIAAILMRYLEK